MVIRGGWSRQHLRPVVLGLLAGLAAAVLVVKGRTGAAVAALVVALAIAAGLALVVLGNRVAATAGEVVFRAGFLRYAFPWAAVRGFVLDDRSPSGVYVAALHPVDRSLHLFEVPAVKAPSALALAATLSREARWRRLAATAAAPGASRAGI